MQIPRVRLLLVGLLAGVLFGTMDALLHANPWARSLYEVYAPLVRPDVRALSGTAIDLFYGIVLAWLFIRLSPALPGKSGLAKGLSYGVILWLLRVFMAVASEWVMYAVPGQTLLYTAGTGLVEMLVLGLLYGVTLLPKGTRPTGVSSHG